MPAGEAQGGRDKPGRGRYSRLLLVIKKCNAIYHGSFLPGTGGNFLRGGGSGVLTFASVTKYPHRCGCLVRCPRKK